MLPTQYALARQPGRLETVLTAMCIEHLTLQRAKHSRVAYYRTAVHRTVTTAGDRARPERPTCRTHLGIQRDIVAQGVPGQDVVLLDHLQRDVHGRDAARALEARIVGADEDEVEGYFGFFCTRIFSAGRTGAVSACRVGWDEEKEEYQKHRT